MEKYKVVIIDSLWESIENEQAQKFIYKIFRAKKRGYSGRHEGFYLPLGKEDFVCLHILICKLVKGEYEPICISKIILSSQCRKYNIEHPMISTMRGYFEERYFSHVKSMIEDLIEDGKEISYSGGFTIDRSLLEGRQEMSLLKEIYCAIHGLVHLDRGVDTVFGFGCPRLKTDELFEKWGILKISLDGQAPLGFPKGLNGEEVRCMSVRADQLSFFSHKMFQKYKQLWLERHEELIPIGTIAV